MFELLISFLASPGKIWEKGPYELKRTVIRLAFAAPLNVSRETGLRNAETTLPFKALRFLSTSKSQMVLHCGVELLLHKTIQHFGRQYLRRLDVGLR